ncbi:MAG: sigma 54-interacting transcriptional regulator [Labilithrix sp.]|nr:sigma 54-interacting transcriptional regulator [Labilithrix sp.]
MIDHPRYAIGEVLGEGAQGLVARVVDRERPEAALVAKVARDRSLEGEFALLARLRVPGLVRVHDFARDAAGTPFIVEDFVDGSDPSRWVGRRDERLSALARDLAETLAGLHDAGFAHGDVKPDNVRIPASGRAMLLDLGAASPLRGAASPSVFTPAFAAPELRAGARPSVASDLFALGATLWAVATGDPPAATARPPLRDPAPWITPSAATIYEVLLAAHPSDRPRSARDLLAMLGQTSRGALESASRGPHVRERVIDDLLALASRDRGRRVVYVIGPTGAGKSHVAREAATRAMIAGRACRHVRFPDAEIDAARLVAFLRGDERACPWQHDARETLLVFLDDLHAAPAEVVEALDAFRCRAHPAASPIVVIATAREASEGAETIALGPLDRESFAALAIEIGVAPADVASMHRESGGLPGWAVAASGRVPLTRDAVLDRLEGAPPGARELFAVVATMGGIVPARLVSDAEAASLFVAGLLERERDLVRLSSPQLARDVAEALATFGVSDRAAEIVLGDDGVPASTALAAGAAPSPPARRSEVLAVAATRARREGARAIEIDALLALVASPAERTPERLARLERLTRDAGTARAHPQVLAWLEEAAARDPAIAALASRRRAEERARAGDHAGARAHADRAVAHAATSPARAERGYALSTKGAIALFAADWAGAAVAFESARAEIVADGDGADREEHARLEHNVGVVALYRGRVDEAILAFDRSVAIKRALGDRAGVRACALNLGLALARAERFDEAERMLREATSLAEALGQAAGRGWCLTALADLAVRRGRGREAESLVAEASAIGDALPSPVRADLALLRGQIALLEGDGRAARAAVDAIDPALRRDDAMVDARARVIVARSLMASLPADRRGAAREAIAALRRARSGGIAEAEAEAVRALREARAMVEHERKVEPRERQPAAIDEGAWSVVEAIASGAAQDEVMAKLCAVVLAIARGERAIVALIDATGGVDRAWGSDVDGLPIARAEERVDVESAMSARRRGAPIYLADVATKAGRGSRLAASGARAAILVEHRFVRGAFDHVAQETAARWGVLAELAARTSADPSSASASASASVAPSRAPPRAPGMSTALPVRDAQRDYPEIVGRSPALRRALAQLDAAVDTDLPVLVHGETGTGKELFARAIHDHGARSARAFVAVNCAAIADALFEAELFGHARGAFTGADRARPGLLARAEGGTLLFDEIGELPLPRQATLLRALETKKYRAVGADDERTFDVRVVAATNRDLDAAVEEGTFRRDLLYRLRVLEIAVPPLRDRAGDVAILTKQLLVKAGSRATLTPAALDALEAHPFPGNVRELFHVAQRLAAGRVERVDLAHLPRAIRAGSAAAPAMSAPADPDAQREEVERALARTAGNISRAAVMLGLSRHGLKKRMLRLGLRARAGEES